jgi:sugar lactone lactonase YvrE
MWSTEVPGFPQQFNEPAGLAYSNGTLYVADYGNHAIRQVSPGPGYPPTARTYTGYPGPSFGTQDGTGSAAMFNDPQGMTVDSSGNVYVADYGNNEIRKITPQGAVSTVFNNAGYFVPIYGVGTHSTFFSPVDVAFDSSGNFYVLESTGSIIKITPSYGVSYLVQNAFVGAQAFAIDKSNNLYVTDTNKNVIDKITPNGTVTTIAGVPGVAGTTDGPAGSALFNQPAGIAVDASGDIFVADTNNHTIRKISPGLQVSTLAGWVDRLGNTDGTGSSAQFCYPRGLAMGLDGSVIVADSSNGQIRQVTQAGVVTTLGGYPGAEADKQGDYRNAQFSFPDHVAVAPSGVVYASQSKANVISSGTSGAQLTLIGSGNGVGFNGQWLVGSQTVSFPAGSFINYGNVSPGYDEVATFTVRNTGNTTFKNLSVQIDGGLNMSYFLVTQPSITTLAPSGQTTFTVGFDPATSGTSTANVHVTSTGGSINSFDFAIYGSWYY